MRYAELRQRLQDAVLDPPGHAPGELRHAAFARAARLAGADAGGRTAAALPHALTPYVDKVARHAYQVTDADVIAVQRAGNSEDAVFEITVAAALGAALGRLERGLRALSSPPDTLSATRSSAPDPLSAKRRGGTQGES